jgi:hypothetical protein
MSRRGAWTQQITHQIKRVGYNQWLTCNVLRVVMIATGVIRIVEPAVEVRLKIDRNRV